jgi:hypothetical protein
MRTGLILAARQRRLASALCLLLVLSAVVVGLRAPAHAALVPFDPILSTAPIEGYVFDAQTTSGYAKDVCFGGLRDGTDAAYDYIDSVFGWPTQGSTYSCRKMLNQTCGFNSREVDPQAEPYFYLSKCWSNHAQGRAMDFMVGGVAPAPVPLARGNDLTTWLLEADSNGNRQARARRLGVQQIIWNGRCWRSSITTDRNVVTGAAMRNCGDTSHFNHVHVDFTLAGASGLTSAYNGEAIPRPTAFPGNADVNGDGNADLIAQNEQSVWVKTSTGTSFNEPALWATGPFSGTAANHAADVNGDGNADLIAQNEETVWVKTSTGTSFNEPALWATGPFSGTAANHAADVNGDGNADLIAQNEETVWVKTSTGTSFNAPTMWAVGPFDSEVANHIGDVNGDGKADLIAQNEQSVWVMTSTGTSFNAPTMWAVGPFYGGVANHIGDINADGREDLIAQNAVHIWATTSTGSAFGTPTQWAAGAFQGEVANHG